MTGARNHQASTVRCIETGAIYPTCTAAGKAFGVSHAAISAACRGKAKTIKGHTFEYAKNK